MFHKILVANRGEIAIRVMRACKEMGIQTVAIHSDVDQDSLHVKMADESVCIGPARATESYLHIPAVLSAAHVTDADAVHPGYGFLAENGEFAAVCEKSNFTFIGPTPKCIDLMGDKIAARNTMEKAGVPVLPGAEIKSPDKDIINREAEKIGFPVIIKAAFGGGGRGMQIVHNPDDLYKCIEKAQTEAGQAFGNSTVYLEKYVESSRHIEFQIAADKHGNVVCLGERDCTIQRRHQKLLEEAPSPVLSDEKRSEMIDILSKAMRRIKYSNVGTVEFLYDADDNLYFMEMNTRIQVEHPVTEMVTGIDLIKLQIELANGAKLPIKQDDIKIQGHSIECRINAEDPIRFRPSVGVVTDYHVPGGYGVRVDSLLYQGYQVLPYYDSLLAKLIVHGRDRTEAIRRMRSALDELIIVGIECNADFHKKVLKHKQFEAADYDSHFAQYIKVR